jgi:hypothetical protein
MAQNCKATRKQKRFGLPPKEPRCVVHLTPLDQIIAPAKRAFAQVSLYICVCPEPVLSKIRGFALMNGIAKKTQKRRKNVSAPCESVALPTLDRDPEGSRAVYLGARDDEPSSDQPDATRTGVGDSAVVDCDIRNRSCGKRNPNNPKPPGCDPVAFVPSLSWQMIRLSQTVLRN